MVLARGQGWLLMLEKNESNSPFYFDETLNLADNACARNIALLRTEAEGALESCKR